MHAYTFEGNIPVPGRVQLQQSDGQVLLSVTVRVEAQCAEATEGGTQATQCSASESEPTGIGKASCNHGWR